MRARGGPVEEEALNGHCKNCGSEHLTRHFDHGEVVCNDCGVVNEDLIIDHGQDWRSFDRESDAKKARTGAPTSILLPDKGLSTVIGWRDTDTYGKSIPAQSKAQLYRLRKWQRRMRTSSSTERNLSYALGEVDRLSSALGLPKNVRSTAALVYRKAVMNNLVRGRTIEGVVAACVYAATRQCNMPRTLNEISLNTHLDRKEVGRMYRFLARELSVRMLPAHPEDYIKRYALDLKLSSDTEKKASGIMKQVMQRELTSGCGPTGLAAATLYIACVLTGEKRTQSEIAAVAHVTEVTIRSRYKCIADKLKIELPKP